MMEVLEMYVGGETFGYEGLITVGDDCCFFFNDTATTEIYTE